VALRDLPVTPRQFFPRLIQRPARLGRRTWDRARAASRVARARAGCGAGLVCAAWGIGVLFGFGWALLAGGLAVSVSFLLLYPVDETP
jgi:hypothetical protein